MGYKIKMSQEDENESDLIDVLETVKRKLFITKGFKPGLGLTEQKLLKKK